MGPVVKNYPVLGSSDTHTIDPRDTAESESHKDNREIILLNNVRDRSWAPTNDHSLPIAAGVGGGGGGGGSVAMIRRSYRCDD